MKTNNIQTFEKMNVHIVQGLYQNPVVVTLMQGLAALGTTLGTRRERQWDAGNLIAGEMTGVAI